MEEEYAKELPDKIMRELKFRYGAVVLDGFDIVDVRLKTSNGCKFGIFLELKKD